MIHQVVFVKVVQELAHIVEAQLATSVPGLVAIAPAIPVQRTTIGDLVIVQAIKLAFVVLARETGNRFTRSRPVGLLPPLVRVAEHQLQQAAAELLHPR